MIDIAYYYYTAPSRLRSLRLRTGSRSRRASRSQWGWEENERKIQKLAITCKAVQLFIQLFPSQCEIHSCGTTPLSRQQLIELRRNKLVECLRGEGLGGGGGGGYSSPPQTCSLPSGTALAAMLVSSSEPPVGSSSCSPAYWPLQCSTVQSLQ